MAAVALLRTVEGPWLHGSNAELLVVVALWGVAASVALLAAWAAGGSRSRVCRRAGLVLLPLAIAAIACEAPVLAGGFDWRRVLPPAGDDVFIRLRRVDGAAQSHDPDLLFTRPAGERVSGDTFGDCVGWLGAPAARQYGWDLQYDDRGYRNDRTHERADIAVVGDSFVEAALVAGPELFTSRMAKELGLVVANFGVGGYGPQQEHVVLRRHALPIAPRLVY